MELRVLGNSGLRVSHLALGTMTWGRDTDENEAADQLRAFLDAGGNLIDTAAIYGDGDSERVIGGFLNTLVSREDLVIATKAGISNRDGARIINNSRAALLSELDKSLSRLGVTEIDLWQVHTRVVLYAFVMAQRIGGPSPRVLFDHRLSVQDLCPGNGTG